MSRKPKPIEVEFESVVAEDDDTPTTLQDAIPAKYGSAEWTEYVLSHLLPEEHIDGHPRCNGLRRIAQMLLGDIVLSHPKTVIVSQGENGRVVTVCYEITFDWKMNTPTIMNSGELATLSSDLRTFGGLADCAEDLASTYGRHPAATAETKAESRALRKALSINVITAEERVAGTDMVEEAKTPSNAIVTKPLLNMIRAKMKHLNIAEDEIKCKLNISGQLEKISMATGQELFQHLNSLQQR